MFQKSLFILAHQLGDPNFYPTYRKVLQSQWIPYSDQKTVQEKKLKYIINFAYHNVPYYHKILRELRLKPSEFNIVEDLEKLPILTKDIIKANWDDFKPLNLSRMKFYDQFTGGSTGTPLRYRLSKHDRFLFGALLYRGWGYADYNLGDKVIFLAGSSLDVSSKTSTFDSILQKVRNINKLSSFDMNDYNMNNYVRVINSLKPKFLRGYASSIYFFAKYIQENNINVQPLDAVFTTSEKLFPYMRLTISEVFGCCVYDGYGLNDGGITAYECGEHAGLHVDTERSLMEIVDENGCQLEEGTGDILVTSLHNFAMPFIRYQTGDMGNLLADVCGCGRESKLLKEVIGRQHEMLQTPEGKFVHGAFFNSYMFGKISGVVEFQVIQKSLEKIVVKIVTDENFDEKQLDNIRTIIKSKSERWNIEFKFVDQIQRTKAGKYKFIVNEVGK